MEITKHTKQFKARIEFDNTNPFHAIEVWFSATNIIDAGNTLITYFGAIGIDEDDVKKLIEINASD